MTMPSLITKGKTVLLDRRAMSRDDKSAEGEVRWVKKKKKVSFRKNWTMIHTKNIILVYSQPDQIKMVKLVDTLPEHSKRFIVL